MVIVPRIVGIFVSTVLSDCSVVRAFIDELPSVWVRQGLPTSTNDERKRHITNLGFERLRGFADSTELRTSQNACPAHVTIIDLSRKPVRIVVQPFQELLDR